MKRIEDLFNLTPLQRKHAESVLWLFGNKNRREGRSHLMMYVLARLAYETPGQQFSLVEHAAEANSPQGYMAEMMAKRMADILKLDPALSNRLVLFGGRVPYVRYLEPDCANCKKPLREHTNEGKCLFGSTEFE